MTRFLITALCLATSACATPPPVDRQALADEYRRDMENQLGITRARKRQLACTRAPTPSIGMTASQVLSSCWGKPDHAAESVTAQGQAAVWSYPEGYVYLSDNVVTKIVTAR